MSTYQTGDLLLIKFPFTDASAAKKRPALVILDTGDEDIWVARVTSQIYDTQYDVSLQSWKTAGLLRPAVVRLHKMATLQKMLVEKRLGNLAAEDLKAIRLKLQDIFGAKE